MTQSANPIRLGNPRWWKETRLLLLPAVVAAAAACLVPILAVIEYKSPGEGIFSLLKGFAWLAFLGCLLLIACAPLGWEYQHRTLSMLLAQPFTRSQLWLEKMLPAVVWVVAICLFGWLVHWALLAAVLPPNSLITQDPPGGVRAIEARHFFANDLGILFFFVPASLCAAPVWTMLTRSTIGGVTFTVGSQFLGALLANVLVEKAHLPEAAAFPGVAILYMLLFLWLSWRMFAALQVTDGTAAAAADLNRGAPGAAASAGGKVRRRRWFGRLINTEWLDRVFRCCPSGPTANLFRKEVRLQRPVYQVGVCFVLCWLFIFVIDVLGLEKGSHPPYDVITAFYIPLVFLLAGSISTGEEHSLGVSGWHLTLPLAAGKQWGSKLAVSAATAIAAGWALPLLLFSVTSLVCHIGYITGQGFGQFVLFLTCLSVALFLAAFWAVSLTGNTVRAVMLGLVMLVALFFAYMLAQGWARVNLGIAARVALAFAVLVGAPPGREWNYLIDSQPYFFVGGLLALVAVALRQTFLLFRRPDLARKPFILFPAMLLFGALLFGAVLGSLEAGRAQIAAGIP